MKTFAVLSFILLASVSHAQKVQPEKSGDKNTEHPAVKSADAETILQLEARFRQLYAKYPATASLDNKAFVKAPIDWSSNAMARKYKTALSELYGKTSAPNFAGSYIIENEIGCGTGCQVVFVIDPKNGKVYYPNAGVYVEYRVDSKLIILNQMCGGECERYKDEKETGYQACMEYAGGPPQLLIFENKKFKKIPMVDCKPET